LSHKAVFLAKIQHNTSTAYKAQRAKTSSKPSEQSCM